MTLEIYLAFVTAAAVLIIIPGPTNMVVVSNAMKFGFKKSLWTVAGAAISHAFLLAIACMGVATILMASARVFEVIRWVGVFYLIWIGVKLWITDGVGIESCQSQSGISVQALFIQGFAVNTSNPKALIFYSAFFPPFLNPQLPLGPQLIAMGVTFVGIFLLIAILHGFIADRTRVVFQRPHHQTIQNRIAGSLLIGAGLLLATAKRS